MSASPPTSPGERLARLAEQVRALSRSGKPQLPPCPSGLPALDDLLGGGLARGAIHELLAPGASAAVLTVALLIATRAAERHRWIFLIDAQQDFYPPAAAQLGVPLERLVVLRATRQADALWACEQILRCRSVGAVIAPLRALDPYVSRRLQLAAEAGENLGLFIRPEHTLGPTFAATRLRIEPRVAPPRAGRLRIVPLKLPGGRLGEPVEVELGRAVPARRPLPGLAPVACA